MRSLEQALELLRQQRAAALAWRAGEVEELSTRIGSLRSRLQEELAGADRAQREALAPLAAQVHRQWCANRSLIEQALGLVREWRRVLCGTRAVSYDRSGRPVETRPAAGGRVA
ncbi:MAG: hypothetical protein GYA21_02620 [Myxococcales bacterium]|nr:hypothetical protein [Myxococcales bacterium]